MDVIYSVNVYGEFYERLFFELHIPSLIKSNNFLDFKDRLLLYIYTRRARAEDPVFLSRYNNVRQIFPCKLIILPELPDENFFENRYKYLTLAAKHTIESAIAQRCLFHLSVADFVYGADFWKNIFETFDNGSHDLIQIQGIRVVDELVFDKLKSSVASSALDSDRLLSIAQDGLAPMWIAAHWETPRFSIEPFWLIWSARDSLLVHSLGWIPVLGKPHSNMLMSNLSPDHGIAQFAKYVFCNSEHSPFPICKVSTLNHLYVLYRGATFGANPPSTREVAEWLFKTSVVGNKDPSGLRRMLKSPVLYRLSGSSRCASLFDKSEQIISEINWWLLKRYNFNV